jgi:CubicO group peptidase (beta-lactamase class C family)
MSRRIFLLVFLCLSASFSPAVYMCGADLQEKPLDERIAEFLPGYLAELTKSGNFSGIVYWARGADVLFKGAYGYASRDYMVPNDIDTKFNLASASKMFTAVAVAQLGEAGKLSLDDPVSKYLGEDWIAPDDGARVGIKHLLSHTSGLGNYWTEEYDNSSKLLFLKIDDYKKLISTTPAFEPGTKWHYSNTGYIVLGAVVKKVTGESFFDYVQKNIFDPCGMTNTGFYYLDRPVPNIAVGYYEDKEDGGILKNNLFLHTVRSASAGGGWSTAPDMHRFFLALRDNKLIKAETRDLFWAKKPNAGNYGYGFMNTGIYVGHSGGFPGIEAWTYFFPATDNTLIVFSNYYGSASPLIREMNKMLVRGK